MIIRTTLLILCCLALLGAFLAEIGKIQSVDVLAALILAGFFLVTAQLPWER